MKDFDSWNIKKKNLHKESKGRFYHVRDIWWCALGVNIGFERDESFENFLRPVLIIKGLSKETCLVVPLTTSMREHKYRISVGSVTGKEAKVILSQMRVVDTKRLIEKIVMLDKATFEAIKKSIRNLF